MSPEAKCVLAFLYEEQKKTGRTVPRQDIRNRFERTCLTEEDEDNALRELMERKVIISQFDKYGYFSSVSERAKRLLPVADRLRDLEKRRSKQRVKEFCKHPLVVAIVTVLLTMLVQHLACSPASNETAATPATQNDTLPPNGKNEDLD